MKEGSTVIMRNAKIDMYKGSMRLAVDRWGRVESTDPDTRIITRSSRWANKARRNGRYFVKERVEIARNQTFFVDTRHKQPTFPKALGTKSNSSSLWVKMGMRNLQLHLEGVLMKLIDGMSLGIKPTSKYRSSLLQVTDIVPIDLDEKDFMAKHGFYIKVSDSVNSIYVSLLFEIDDLILSNKIQISQQQVWVSDKGAKDDNLPVNQLEKKSATSSSSRTMSSPISGLKVKSPSADSSFRTSLSGSLPQKLSILGKEKKSATSSSSRTMSSPISGLKVKSPSADSSFRTSLSGSLPQKLSILGKEAVQQQERAQRIAFEALRNASATNTLVWSLQNLSTLTKSANSVDPTDCFDNFLKFHNQLIQAIADIISIKAATETTKKEETTPKKSTEVNGPDSNNISKRKSALHKSVSSFPGKSLQKSTVLGKHTRSSGVDQNGKTGSLNDTIKLGQQIEIEAGNWFMELLDKHLGNGMRYSKPDAKKVPHSLIVKALNWVESNQCDSRNNRVHPKAIDIARKLRIKAKRMASSEIRHRPYPCPTIAINLPKAMDKPRKSLNRPKGVQIKVQSPSSASAVRVRFSNVFVLTKVLTNDSSLVDVGKGKRSNSSVIPIDDALTKVLDKMAYIKCVSEQMVFCEGVRDFDMKSSNAVKIGSNVKDSSMQMVTDCDKVENDGSVINGLVRKVNDEYDKQTIGSDKVECREDFNMVDSTLSTDNVSVHNVADVEHVDDAHRGHHPPQPPLSSALAHVTYGDKSVEKYVGYSKLNYENYCFVTELNKSCEPKIEASKYTDWTDAMNEEMNALLRNDT
ncbi:DUF936 domain-containing protein [Tanacetum coccineum]